MNRFETLEVALQMVAIVRPVIEAVDRRDKDLARQMRKCTTSVPSNLAEGNRRRGKDRLHLWDVSLGSADELGVQLRVTRSWQYAAVALIDAADVAVDRVRAMTYRLIDSRR
jgi:four helix bundle protein